MGTDRLAKQPALDAVFAARAQGFTGSLESRLDQDRAVLVFEAGRIKKAFGMGSPDHLGHVLVDLKIVSKEALAEAIATLAQKAAPTLLGEHLLAQRVLDQAGLARGLRVQMERKVHYFVAMPPAAVVRTTTDDLLDWVQSEIDVSVDVRAIAWSLALASPPLPNIDAYLGALPSGLTCVLSSDHLDTIEANVQAKIALHILRQGCPTTDLTQPKTPYVLKLLAYVLHRTGALETRPDTRALEAELLPYEAAFDEPLVKTQQFPSFLPNGGDQPQGVSAPPSSRAVSTAIAQRRQEILTRADAIGWEDPPTILGVPPEASRRQIDNAYVLLVARWRPDLLPAELSDLRGACSIVLARIGAAYRQLLAGAKDG